MVNLAVFQIDALNLWRIVGYLPDPSRTIFCEYKIEDLSIGGMFQGYAP